MKIIAKKIGNGIRKTRFGRRGVVVLKRALFRYHFRYCKIPKRQTKYYFSAVLIFKDEDRYLKEWIEYHRLIGVDHVYAYNDGSTDDYLKVLSPYIDEGYVTLVEWKKPHSQMEAYTDCWQRFKDETFWMMFIDVDEFICPYKNQSITEWIRPYEHYCSVTLFWRHFSTGGIMDYDATKLVTERFTKASPTLRPGGKIVLNTAYQPVHIYHHSIECYVSFLGKTWIIPPIDEERHFIMDYATDSYRVRVLKMPSINTIQLNHYWSKSYEEYQRKMSKGDVSYIVDKSGRESRERFLTYERQCTFDDFTIFQYLPKLKRWMKMEA